MMTKTTQKADIYTQQIAKLRLASQNMHDPTMSSLLWPLQIISSSENMSKTLKALNATDLDIDSN